jgi:biopolymer transport protein ExbD
MEFARSKRHQQGIVITSLVDVMILLVIFFMLTATFERAESMEISLPSGAASVPVNDNPLVVVAAERGRIFFDDRKISMDELGNAVTQSLIADKTRHIVVMNTEGTTVQELVSVMDAIYKAGGQNVSLSSWSY